MDIMIRDVEKAAQMAYDTYVHFRDVVRRLGGTVPPTPMTLRPSTPSLACFRPLAPIFQGANPLQWTPGHRRTVIARHGTMGLLLECWGQGWFAHQWLIIPSFLRPSLDVFHPVIHAVNSGGARDTRLQGSSNPPAQAYAASSGGLHEVGGGAATQSHATATIGSGVGAGLVQLSLIEYQALLKDATAGRKGEERKVDVRSRLRERDGGMKRIESDEYRRLGSRCRCGSDHRDDPCCPCTVARSELLCTYPPCSCGHETSACFELMKRCRMAICRDQRGHMAGSHFKFKPGRRVWYIW